MCDNYLPGSPLRPGSPFWSFTWASDIKASAPFSPGCPGSPGSPASPWKMI